MNKKLLIFAVGLGILMGSAQATETSTKIANTALSTVVKCAKNYPKVTLAATLTLAPLTFAWGASAATYAKESFDDCYDRIDDLTWKMFAGNRKTAFWATVGLYAGLQLQKHTSLV